VAEAEEWVAVVAPEYRASAYPADLSSLESRPSFCHADPAACQNSREFPQIASDFRRAGLPVMRQTSLQNGHI
jgi:hypothetical protein